MAANKGMLVVMLWTICQLGVSAQILLPSQIGSACDTDDRCNRFIPSTACIEKVCACIRDFVPNFANASCLRVATNLGDLCEEAIQCTERFGSNAECNSTQRCNCKPGHHFISSPPKCVEHKGLGDKCNDTTQCYLPDDGPNQYIECAEQQCRCIAGYEKSPDNRSCKGSAATKIISITCLVGVWILHLFM